MISVEDLKKTTEPTNEEKACGDHILKAAGEQISAMFANDNALRTFEIDRKPLAKAALTATKQTVTPKVRAYMVERAKESSWNLDTLGGDEGDKLIFTMKRGGRGRKPDTAEQKAEKAAAKAKAAADATPETVAD